MSNWKLKEQKMVTTDDLRNEFTKQTNVAAVFANRTPYIKYIIWLEKQLTQVENLGNVNNNEAGREHNYSDGTGTGYYVCRKCGDIC